MNIEYSSLYGTIEIIANKVSENKELNKLYKEFEDRYGKGYHLVLSGDFPEGNHSLASLSLSIVPDEKLLTQPFGASNSSTGRIVK